MRNTFHIFCDCIDCDRRDQIISRLKKRIEELENETAKLRIGDGFSDDEVRLLELQKILEGKE